MYRELLGFVEELKKKEPKKALAWFRAACESDFWLWQKEVMSLGRLEIKDLGHRRYGKLWVMEPWFFDRMREAQEDFDSGRTNVLYQMARFTFKSSAIQKGGALWFLAKDRTQTIAIMTHKADKVGQDFMKDYLDEITGNQVLLAHWPQYRNLRDKSAKAITVERPPGIREASISVHGTRSSAASGHYRIIFLDDPVDPEERSIIVLDEVDHRLNMVTFLGHDDTQKFWIGCPAHQEDPIERRKKRGVFSIIRKHPGILPGGKYPLRSKAFLDQWKREVTEELFSSQVLLQMVPPGRRFFREEWMVYYGRTDMSEENAGIRGDAERRDAARGTRIHILIDPAEGRKMGGLKNSDFLVLWVLAFTHERKRRALDLWRERMSLADASDLLFGLPPGDETLVDHAWKARNDLGLNRGLVTKWKRLDRHLTVWIEEVGASQFVDRLRLEMTSRKRQNPLSPTCTIRELRSNIPKDARISALQPPMRNGDLEFPLSGFGHGSYTTNDKRDTLIQFKEDELLQWTLKGDVLYDDTLDTLAWPDQPGISMPYPDPLDEEGSPQLFSMESPLASGGGWSSEVPSGSWRVS